MNGQRTIRTWFAVAAVQALLIIGTCDHDTVAQNTFPTPSGNVGIGTTNPGETLHVNNAVRISPFSPNAAGDYLNAGAALRLINGNIYQTGGNEVSSIQFGGMYNPSGTQTDAFYNYIDWSAGWLRVRNNQQTKIQIGGGDEWGRQDIYFNPSGGNVGIGTTSPSVVLEVRKASGEGLRVSSGNATAFTYASVGRTGEDALFGVAGATNHFWTGVAQGDAVLKMNTSAKLHVGSNQSTPEMTFSAGNVGIGTTSPGTKLNLAAASDQTFRIDNTSSTYLALMRVNGSAAQFGASNATSVQLVTNDVARLTVLPTSGNVGIGKTDPTVALDVVGDIKASGVIHAKYQDVAEWVESSEQLAAGTVVVLDSTKSNQVISSSQSYDTRVAGVISAQPGIMLGEKTESKVLVATTGRVKIKVDATKSPIQIGDLLVTSDVSGVAMKSEAVNLGGVQFHRPGTLIGKALEPLAKGKGEILVLLSLQ